MRLSQGSIPSVPRGRSFSTVKLENIANNSKYKTIPNNN